MMSCRVLVVEDDPEFRSLLAQILTGAGYAVSVADSAIGTAAQIREFDPGVILLDLALPYRSGATLLAELKADRRTADIPILVVSAFLEILSAERRALVAAALEKPIDARKLLDTIERVLAATPRTSRKYGDRAGTPKPRTGRRTRESAGGRARRPS